MSKKKKNVSKPIIIKGGQRRNAHIKKGIENKGVEVKAFIKKERNEKEDKKKAEVLQYEKNLKIRKELDEQIAKEEKANKKK